MKTAPINRETIASKIEVVRSPRNNQFLRPGRQAIKFIGVRRQSLRARYNIRYAS